MKICPQCGAKHPDSDISCECFYEFPMIQGETHPSHLSETKTEQDASVSGTETDKPLVLECPKCKEEMVFKYNSWRFVLILFAAFLFLTYAVRAGAGRESIEWAIIWALLIVFVFAVLITAGFNAAVGTIRGKHKCEVCGHRWR